MKRLTKRELRTACSLYAASFEQALPDPSLYAVRPSDAAFARMQPALESAGRLSPGPALRRLAAAAAVVVLILGTTLTVNAGIREKVLELFRTIRTNQIDYNFEDSIEATVTKLPQLNADKHYDGFEAEEIYDVGEYRDEFYINEITGDSIFYTCATINSFAEFGVGGNIETRETVDVHGFEGDLYHTTENVPENTLIWVDTEQNIAFMISTTLSVEDVYDMVDLIYR